MAITPASFPTSGTVLTATQYNYLPRGVVAQASNTASTTGVSAVADVTGLSVTWTATSTRMYRVTAFMGAIQQSTSTGIVTSFITDGSNSAKQQANVQLTATEFGHISLGLIETSLSGSVTRKIRIQTSAGTVAALYNAAYPSYILVEDLGIF